MIQLTEYQTQLHDFPQTNIHNIVGYATIIGINMHSNFVIDIDIQEENEKAENMMNQIQKIINEYRGQPLSTDLFYTVTDKIKAKCKYFEKHDFPPMFCLMTMYGVALVDKKQEDNNISGFL